MDDHYQYKRQQLDLLVGFFKENAPRPQQNFMATAARLKELLPGVYAEFDENLEPLDLLETGDYKFWVNRQLRLPSGFWLDLLALELDPPGTEHDFDQEFIEEQGYFLEELLRPDDLPQDRRRILTLCDRSLRLLMNTRDECFRYLEAAEKKALEAEELFSFVPAEEETFWVDHCTYLWDPRRLHETEAFGLEFVLERLNIACEEKLMGEVRRLLPLYPPRTMYSYLQRLFFRFAEFRDYTEKDTWHPVHPSYPKALWTEEPAANLRRIRELQLEQLYCVVSCLDEQLAGLLEQINGEGISNT